MRFLILLLSLVAAAPLFGATPFLRLGTGLEHGAATTVHDRDCASATPPALFGCVAGNDGRALGARGDSGKGIAWEVGAGVEWTRASRVELALARRGDLDLDAEANFIGVHGRQPVDARIRSTSALLIASHNLGDHFFISAGAGAARNEIGTTQYGFPGIAADAVTIMPGGTTTGFAWTASAGITLPLSERLALDVGVRYTDLGAVRSEDGEATILRPNRTLTLNIAGTEADLATSGLTVSMRWRR